MAKPKIPEYIKLTNDGANVELFREYTFADGTKRKSLHVREYTVNDQEEHLTGIGSAVSQEKGLLSACTGLTPNDIGQLTARDYLRLQNAFALFID